MEVVLALVLFAVLAAFVTMPVWRSEDTPPDAIEDPVRAELEARKQAKYRQIREVEMDREQGKLSQADWARADAELRREAIAILRELDGLERHPPG